MRLQDGMVKANLEKPPRVEAFEGNKGNAQIFQFLYAFLVTNIISMNTVKTIIGILIKCACRSTIMISDKGFLLASPLISEEVAQTLVIATKHTNAKDA